MKKGDNVNIDCPKCNNGIAILNITHGGSAIYHNLICKNCGFEGGTVRYYFEDENSIEKKVIARYNLNANCDCRNFVNSILGK